MESPSMNGGPHARASSPPSCFSILITSAPMSPRIMPAIGPATACPISITLMPASGPFMAFLLSDSRHRPPRFARRAVLVALARIDQIFFAGRAFAIAGDVLQLQRFLQRHFLGVVAGKRGLEFVQHALTEPRTVGRPDLLQERKQQPTADTPGHSESAGQFGRTHIEATVDVD